MSRGTLYSSSRDSGKPRAPSPAPGHDEPASQARVPAAVSAAASGTVAPARWQTFYARFAPVLWLVTGGLLAVLVIVVQSALAPARPALTQQDIDAAVLQTLETAQLPSPAAKAYEAIRPSVVKVIGLGPEQESDKLDEPSMHSGASVGTGVVIVDKGIILTSLHVVAEAERVKVQFFDGLVADATIIGARPEHDLAVLQAQTIPDDLAPATLRSTTDLAVGDSVLAVGFPFGIGPSASAGVVSGLRREYQSPEGKRLLTNLIQFDAAVNPGSSGGPLVTADGEVVGIVTAILNPSEQHVFIGIGFAVPIENAAAAVGLSPF